MCVILIKEKNQLLPSKKMLLDARERNPHGAGFAFFTKNYVEIHKGYMDFDDFYENLCKKVDASAACIIHFRISTQAGVCAEMTQPFAYTSNINNTKKLDVKCEMAIAHNGVIPITSNGNPEYSDTALFITNYFVNIIKNPKDFKNKEKLKHIQDLIGFSKLAILDKHGKIYKIGKFVKFGGYERSNLNHLNYKNYCKKYRWDEYL